MAGRTKNYSESLYHDELAIIDTSGSDADQVISVPDSRTQPVNEEFGTAASCLSGELATCHQLKFGSASRILLAQLGGEMVFLSPA
jgi:hypothetical protein